MSVICYAAFAVAYLTLSWAANPQDDNSTHGCVLPVSFFVNVHDIPEVFVVGGNLRQVALQA